MKKNKDFAVFILTYGRANRVYTYNTLKKQNYTGKIYLICSTDDKELENYKLKFKDKVIIFNKNDYYNKFDLCDNFKDKKTVIFARNALWNIAKRLKINYFLELDDDYTEFRYTNNNKNIYLTKSKKIKNLDKIFKLLLNYYKNINCKSLCIAQGGDFIGGENSNVFKKRVIRKAMNFFICSSKREFKFIGRMNDDVNTYVRLGSIGDIFLTITDLRLEQLNTQSNKGGLTDMYLNYGTYIKSFYTIINSPSNVKIGLMGNKFKRLHHFVDWNKTVPKIIDEKYAK